MPSVALSKQAILVVLGDGISLLATTVLSMLLARLLTQGDMGTYRQISYLGAMAVTIFELGIAASIYRFWNSLEATDRQVYLRMVLIALVSLCSFAMFVLLLGAPLVARLYGNADLNSALLLAAVYPLAEGPLLVFRPILLSQGHPIRATSIDMGFTVVSALSLILPVYWGWSFLNCIALWSAASLSRLFTLTFLARDIGGFHGPWWSRSIFREVWSYIWPIQVSRIPGLLAKYFDKIMMSLFLSPNRFAVYSLGAREVPFIGSIGYSIGSVLLPHLVEDAKHGRVDEFCRRTRRAAEMTAISTYVIAAFCVWNAAPVMTFFFTDSYSDSAIPFRIFAVFTFLRVIEYGCLPKALGRTDIIMKSAFLTLVTVVVLAVVLVPVGGMAGMAWSVIGGTVVSASYILYRSKNLLNRGLLSFFGLHRLGLIAAVAFASVGMTSLLFEKIGGTSLGMHSGFMELALRLGGQLAFSAIVYLVILQLLGVLRLSAIKETLVRTRTPG